MEEWRCTGRNEAPAPHVSARTIREIAARGPPLQKKSSIPLPLPHTTNSSTTPTITTTSLRCVASAYR